MKNTPKRIPPVVAALALTAVTILLSAQPSQAQHRRGRRARTAAPAAVTLTAAVGPKLTTRQRIERAVEREAARHRLDPLLIWALLNQESGWRVDAVSHAGAEGPMQLMPGTARRWGVKNPRDPDEAVRGGVAYLVWLIDRYNGNVALGLAGYNSGEGNVDKYGRRIPPFRETQQYVRSIAAGYERLLRKHGREGREQASPFGTPEVASENVTAEKEAGTEAAEGAAEERPLLRLPAKLRVNRQ